MKKILLTLSFLVVAASLSASAPGTTIRRFSAPKTLAADASEQLYKVTPELTVDIPGGDIAPGMHAVPHNFTHYDYGADEDYFELPAGMYDFLFYFYKGDENYVVVRENVDVKSDMTVKAAMSEADQLLSARMVLSDGSEIRPNAIIGFDDAGERIFDTDGNVAAASQCIHLIALNGNSAASYTGSFYRMKNSDGTFEENPIPSIHINRNNALGVIFSSCVTPKDAPAHIITLQANKDNVTECVTMDPKLYSKIDQRFPELPAEKQAELGSWFDQGVTFMRGDITICNDEQFGQIASLENFDFGSTMIYDNGLTAVKPCPMLNRTYGMTDSGDSFASGFLYIENEADGFKTLGCNFPASPNWGTTLACALSQVDRTSATGWFDVRESLKSATGSSVNLVSPAFRISEFAGIERISDDTATTDAPAEYFTIDGRRVSAPEPGSIVLCRRAGAVTKLIAR